MLSLKGVGPLVRSWGEFRNTLGSLRPLSGLCSLGKVPNFFYFFSSTWTTCNIFVNNFSTFPNFFNFFLKLFSNFSKCFPISLLHVYTCSSLLFHGLQGLGPKGGALSQLVMGCVTCHTCHSWVTHFRPILGNIVEVTLMTFPILYIVSHAKGTSFPYVESHHQYPHEYICE